MTAAVAVAAAGVWVLVALVLVALVRGAATGERRGRRHAAAPRLSGGHVRVTRDDKPTAA